MSESMEEVSEAFGRPPSGIRGAVTRSGNLGTKMFVGSHGRPRKKVKRAD